MDRNSKFERSFNHIEHKDHKDAANPRLFCRFFVFYAFLVVKYVLH